MNIVFAASEAVPFVKTGGLGDVGGALPAALARLGEMVSLFVPAHREQRLRADPAWPRTPIQTPAYGSAQVAEVVEVPSQTPGLRTFWIDYPRLFDREGLYVDLAGNDFPDNNNRYAFFCRAVLAAVEALELPVDVFHAHDWQTGLLPVYLRTPAVGRLQNAASVFTIHNLAYQGNFSFQHWHETLLPSSLASVEGLEFYGKFSHLKGGVVFADAVTTVSPTYAREIQTPEFGCHMDGLLRHISGRLTGVTNGIDARLWDPAADPQLQAAYTLSNSSAGRAANKRGLRKRAGFSLEEGEQFRPLIAIVGRLTEQKGFDLLAALIDGLVDRGAELFLLATSSRPDLEQPLREAAERHPNRVAVHFAMDDSLARLVFAGADILVVPSRFEPCGLTQLYAMRYGAVPVVRAVGGLFDTVVDATPNTLADETATGFLFYEATPDALRAALQRALRAYENNSIWQRLVRTGMSRNSSWDRVAGDYIPVYRQAIARRGR